MDRIPVTLALSPSAFEQVKSNSQNRWISWEFPDYVIKLELDSSITEGVIHRHDGRRLESQIIMAYVFPQRYLPDDVTRLVRHSYAEAVRCYENSCFLGCIALCGRTIETVLGSLYEKNVGVHPSREPTKPGINAIINRLSRDGYVFSSGLKERMELIALHRNAAVHGNSTIPTEDEARSVLYSTRDVLRASSAER